MQNGEKSCLIIHRETSLKLLLSKWILFTACNPDCQLLCLKMHNYYRALHHSPPLKCDPELAKSAQKWTDQQAADGKMYHSEWTDKFTESISWKGWGWEGMGKMQGAIPGAARSWYSEIKNKYDYETGEGSGVIGHFQAVVWKGETRLGCGLNIKPSDGTYVTAHYAPPSHTFLNKTKEAPLNIKPRKQPGAFLQLGILSSLFPIWVHISVMTIVFIQPYFNAHFSFNKVELCLLYLLTFHFTSF